MEPASDRAARSIETAWLSESARLTLREARSFARAFAGITFRPARFASAWVRGDASAMNPLGYFATSAAILAVCTRSAARSWAEGGTTRCSCSGGRWPGPQRAHGLGAGRAGRAPGHGPGLCLLDPPGYDGGHFSIGAEQGGERVWWPAYGF